MSGEHSSIPALSVIRKRLPVIFLEGTDQRNYLIRDIAAKTIFVMFYVDAVEGNGHWLRPNQVTRMNDQQARLVGADERRAWRMVSLRKEGGAIGDRWYATDTREPIRDETLRNSLQPVGAVVEREGLPKTSSTPRWALAKDFAELFTIPDAQFPDLVERWRARHLTPAARARLALVQRGIAAGGTDRVLVTFPNGATRALAPGMSSEIGKAVIEEFSSRFLDVPGVLWLSETSRKDEAADMDLAHRVHLPINPNELLPDIILVDLGADEPRFVFVELVTSDGPVTEERRLRFVEMVRIGGHDPRNTAFVTAFLDRGSSVYRKVASQFAWGSFVWFASEPDKLILHLNASSRPAKLFDLIDR